MHKNLKDSKVGRGVNLAAFDGKTFDVKLVETFDTYLEGKSNDFLDQFYDYLIRNILSSNIEIEFK